MTVSGAAAAGCDSPASAAFPLKMTEGERFMRDDGGTPFFLHGDTAWSLIAELDREETSLYLKDRASRGFNAILVNLIEHKFASKAPANAYGMSPFLTNDPFARPNPVYFDHARWVVEQACSLGLVVLLAPAYAGNGGGSEGWYQEMEAAGAETMQDYGVYVGERFGDLDNIVWVQGGDYNPPDKNLVRALVAGIKAGDPGALQTAHGSPGWAALEYWAGEPWLDLNNVYTYESVRDASLGQYALDPLMPFFLMESAYENEHEASEHRMRMQAYQAILSGASGHIFGNNPIWHFDGPGITEAPMTWQQALNSRGSRSMTVLKDIIAPMRWWLLEPDVDARLVVNDHGVREAPATAARASDGSFALIYLPAGTEVSVDLAQLDGQAIVARWRDPSNGSIAPVTGSPFPAGEMQFTPPGRNFAGYSDWLLELVGASHMEKAL